MSGTIVQATGITRLICRGGPLYTGKGDFPKTVAAYLMRSALSIHRGKYATILVEFQFYFDGLNFFNLMSASSVVKRQLRHKRTEFNFSYIFLPIKIKLVTH